MLIVEAFDGQQWSGFFRGGNQDFNRFTSVALVFSESNAKLLVCLRIISMP